MEKLRAFVKQRMKEQGLSEWQIEKRSDGKITDSYVKDIISGKAKAIGVDKLNALATGLGVDSITLFKLASGEAIAYHQEDPWPSGLLLKAVDRMVNDQDFAAAVKSLLDLPPAKFN